MRDRATLAATGTFVVACILVSLLGPGGTSAPALAEANAPEAALAHLGLAPLRDYRKAVLLRLPFESVAETRGWYETPQTPLTHHRLSPEVVHGGKRAEAAWVTGPNVDDIEPDGPNHRGYPTMQLYKRPRGCVTPCLISLWVWADIVTTPGEWYQIATLTPSMSDAWLPSQLVNVGSEGWLHTMHVPTQGRSDWTYQRTDRPFPRRRWVHVEILVDYRATGGAIAAFQDGVLMSAAPIDASLGENGAGVLNQAHFGLYTAPSIGAGVIYNDDLVISEVRRTSWEK